MKNSITTFLFSAISLCCFAQTPFTEKTVLDMKKRFIENPMKSLNEDLSPNYILAGSGGENFTLDQLKQMAAGVKYLNWNMSELAVKQFGKIGIATGITKHSVLILSNNTTVNYHVRATYIYEYQQDKWQWISAHHTNIAPPPNEEKPEEELKQFVKEYNKDATAFFMDRCSDNFRYTNVEGKFSGKDALKSDKTHTSDSEVSDLKVFQNGNLAVVSGIHSWKDTAMKVVRKVAFTYTMQKVNGKWLFAASHHTDVKE